MNLAAISESITTVIIVVALAMAQWIAERISQKKNKDSAPTETADQPDEPTSNMARPRDSEEERMRRFMEALGIPADSAAPQRGPTPTPLRPPESKPAPKRTSQIPPVPPITNREYNRPQRPPPPIPAAKPPARIPPPVPYGERTLDSSPAPSIPAGRIELPELETTKVEEFHTVSSVVSASHSVITPLTAEEAREKAAADVEREGDRDLWRRALRSPEALRSAFILKEILGPPRGLQSSSAAPSFPLL